VAAETQMKPVGKKPVGSAFAADAFAAAARGRDAAH
jgi:hypothetical protein